LQQDSRFLFHSHGFYFEYPLPLNQTYVQVDPARRMQFADVASRHVAEG
jgi:hypothetical protein